MYGYIYEHYWTLYLLLVYWMLNKENCSNWFTASRHSDINFNLWKYDWI